MVTHNDLSSKAVLMVLTILCTYSMVLCLCLNPNWRSGIWFSRVMSGFNIFSKSLSKSLVKIDSKLMRLYELVRLRFFPGFGIKIIFECFHCFGK